MERIPLVPPGVPRVPSQQYLSCEDEDTETEHYGTPLLGQSLEQIPTATDVEIVAETSVNERDVSRADFAEMSNTDTDSDAPVTIPKHVLTGHPIMAENNVAKLVVSKSEVPEIVNAGAVSDACTTTTTPKHVLADCQIKGRNDIPESHNMNLETRSRTSPERIAFSPSTDSSRRRKASNENFEDERRQRDALSDSTWIGSSILGPEEQITNYLTRHIANDRGRTRIVDRRIAGYRDDQSPEVTPRRGRRKGDLALQKKKMRSKNLCKILGRLFASFTIMSISGGFVLVLCIIMTSEDTVEFSNETVSGFNTTIATRPIGLHRLNPANAASFAASCTVMFVSFIFVITEIVNLCNHFHNRV